MCLVRRVRQDRDNDPRRRRHPHMHARSHAGELGLHVFWTLRQLHVLGPDVLEATPMGHDPVIEGDARIPAAQLSHLKTSRRCGRYIEAVAVALRSEKDVVVGCGVNSLEKSWLKQDLRYALSQLRRARNLETSSPDFRQRRAPPPARPVVSPWPTCSRPLSDCRLYRYCRWHRR